MTSSLHSLLLLLLVAAGSAVISPSHQGILPY
jgi:hypothetical protein